MLREDLNEKINESNIRNPIIVINQPIPTYDPNKKNLDEVEQIDETFAKDYV